MKKTFFSTILTLTALLLFVQSSTVEAKSHQHRTTIQVRAGGCNGPRQVPAVRRYPAPVYVTHTPYYGPVYAYPAPYVEEVYVAPVRPWGFAGLSLNWNFFR